ncbi:HlyD family secretion protein [Leptolyngbya ohadii]|uniref:HlyD family secretion protein n=1 Tax=Leptolyngbya ohadii TaxID=1962290 RepID=UPI000B5A11F0|nr:HlyD family efflux transporter periplasmic adaptor subunit [Leptolyngbya ohadii]
MLKPNSVPLLRPAKTDEFLPPANRWVMRGGMVLLGGLTLAGVLMAIVPYRVTVRAEARVRPDGDVRLVQAPLQGTIERLEVRENQAVQQGDIIARLDRESLDAQKRQTEGSIQQLQLQLGQLEAQDRLLGSQIVAQSRSIGQEVAVTRAELDRQQREYNTQQVTTQADLAEAEAALEFAQSEVQRYEDLASSGSISQLQLEEKRSAARIAVARVNRARAALDPSNAPVSIAQERIAQAQANGQATLATLNREREALRRQRSELQTQLLQAQQTLRQVDQQLQNSAIRATSNGIILRLNLQNAGQVVQAGEPIAEISPQGTPLVIKAAVPPRSIARLQIGQTAFLRVSACPYAEFGVLKSTVTGISPDAVTGNSGVNPAPGNNPASGSSVSRYYEVTLRPEQPALTRDNRQCALQSGMEAEARIVTQSQTLLQFLARKIRHE